MTAQEFHNESSTNKIQLSNSLTSVVNHVNLVIIIIIIVYIYIAHNNQKDSLCALHKFHTTTLKRDMF